MIVRLQLLSLAYKSLMLIFLSLATVWMWLGFVSLGESSL